MKRIYQIKRVARKLKSFDAKPEEARILVARTFDYFDYEMLFQAMGNIARFEKDYPLEMLSYMVKKTDQMLDRIKTEHGSCIYHLLYKGFYD